MLRVRTVFTGVAGLPGYSNLYFDGFGPGSHVTLLNAVKAFWASVLTNCDDACIATIEGDVAVMNVATGQITALDPGANQVTGGANTGTPLPTVCQGLIRYNTGSFVNGRELVGRIFVPCLTQAAGATVPSGPQIVAWAGAANTLVTAAAGAGNAWVAYSKAHGLSRPVTNGQAANVYSVLRSRRD